MNSSLPSDSTTNFSWTLAKRTQRMNPSELQRLFRLAQQQDLISFSGGLPPATAFPVEVIKKACDTVLSNQAALALQYGSSEGFIPLQEWVAKQLPWKVKSENIIITNGSQQGLDLAAKVLVDPNSPILVESPTYLGAMMAFAPFEPTILGVKSSLGGIDLVDLAHKAPGARFMYVLPNFQNPSGRTLDANMRQQFAQSSQSLALPIVEDNPYGELWFTAPPPPPIASILPEQTLYLGSFSKILAPGLRLGYVVAPDPLLPKILQAKQATDLQSSAFTQRVVYEVVKDGYLDELTPKNRLLYQQYRDAFINCLYEHFPLANTSDDQISWNTPEGGMFLWVRLPQNLKAVDFLTIALKHGVGFVPGEPFFAGEVDDRSLRLSFVSNAPDIARTGIARLARALKIALQV